MRNTGQPEGSWYAATAPAPVRPALVNDMDVDVAIIGAGYTGLGAALELARNGMSVCVLEGATVGSGASGRNGGQIHMGQRLDPLTLEAQLGADTARQLWDMAVDARAHLDTVRNISDAAADFAEKNKATELEYYNIVCAPTYGALPQP